MKRESWEDSRYPRGEERYAWDSRHWEESDRFGARDPWRDEEEERPSWLRAVERLFLRLVVPGLVALVLVQVWQHGSFGGWLQFTRFEGKAVSPDQLRAVSGSLPASTAEPVQVTVTLVNLQSAPEARLLVDGREVGRFSGASLTVSAAPGSELRLDPGKDQRTLTFRVTALSDRTRLPRLGTEATARGAPASLGKVQ